MNWLHRISMNDVEFANRLLNDRIISMSDWERKFIRNIAWLLSQGRPLSPLQQQRWNEIKAKRR